MQKEKCAADHGKVESPAQDLWDKGNKADKHEKSTDCDQDQDNSDA